MVKKIAVVTPVFPPYGGGIGRVAREDALILSSKGSNVTVFSPCKHTKSFLKFGNASILVELLWKLIDFDVVHLHYPFFGTAEILWLMKRLKILKSKLVITYHMDVVGSGRLGKFFSWHTKYLMPHILKSADRIIVTSFDYIKYSNAKSIFIKYPEKFEEIPIGVNDNFFAPREKDKNLMSKFGIQVDDKIVLFVGGLDRAHYFKGLSYLLKSFLRLKDKNYKLLIVGDGDLRSQYEVEARSLGISDKVVFAGSVSREDLPKCYNLADIFVLPSIDKSEAFGIVLLEAIASGVPVIASNLHGVRTLVCEGENGFLVEPKNIEDLSEKINRILSDSNLARRMGECGRKTIEEKYSYKRVGE
ncbi:MAG: glycosyltransferase family 4 protein, partial [Parcubacteria group bacterium]|nr:glycosyltransferase family 4 protein [Parcubacteria group bacterium]